MSAGIVNPIMVIVVVATRPSFVMPHYYRACDRVVAFPSASVISSALGYTESW